MQLVKRIFVQHAFNYRDSDNEFQARPDPRVPRKCEKISHERNRFSLYNLDAHEFDSFLPSTDAFPSFVSATLEQPYTLRRLSVGPLVPRLTIRSLLYRTGNRISPESTGAAGAQHTRRKSFQLQSDDSEFTLLIPSVVI